MNPVEEAATSIMDGLVAYRLARLGVLDKITEPLRQQLFDYFPPADWLLDEKSEPKGPIRYWDYKPSPTGPWVSLKGSFLGNMLSCMWCATIWSSMAVVTARSPRLLFRPAKWLRAVLAASAISAIIYSHNEGH